jgi:DNA invertase Pin-like site-specific DNA recombinase
MAFIRPGDARPATLDRARIVALRKEGMGTTEIARAVGCKRGDVYKALNAAGLSERSSGESVSWPAGSGSLTHKPKSNLS